MIDSKDISIIIQGAVDKIETKHSIESIRKFLPKATIILSTWEGTDCSELSPDILILNKDPGSFFCDNNNSIMMNINRQLVSTKNGLARVTTKYAMKLRSDLYFTSDKFLKYFDKFKKFNKNYKYLNHRLIISSLTSKVYSDVGSGLPTPFHTSDWFYFGYTEDLNKFFGAIPLIENEEAFSKYTLKYPDRLPCPHLTFRYAPEQYFAFNFFKSMNKDLQFEDWSDFNENNIKESEILTANNFIVLDTIQHGIYTNKHMQLIKNNSGRKFKFKGYITHYKFLKSYKKYCDKSHIIPIKYWLNRRYR